MKTSNNRPEPELPPIQRVAQDLFIQTDVVLTRMATVGVAVVHVTVTVVVMTVETAPAGAVIVTVVVVSRTVWGHVVMTWVAV